MRGCVRLHQLVSLRPSGSRKNQASEKVVLFSGEKEPKPSTAQSAHGEQTHTAQQVALSRECVANSLRNDAHK